MPGIKEAWTVKTLTKRLIGLSVAGGVAAAIALASQRDTMVDMTPVETREVVEAYIATGRLDSGTVSGVGSELAGRIATVHVLEGDRPKLGQPLVDLQPLDAKLSVQQAAARVAIAERELSRARTGATTAQLQEARAAVSSAEATLEQARNDLGRSKAMAGDGVGTPAEVERATTDVRRAESQVAAAKARLAVLQDQPRAEDLRVAQARVAEAEANLEQTNAALGKTTITAPFDGLVLRVDAAPGENVAPGQTLVTIARTDAMDIVADVDEDYFARIAPGQPATLVFGAMADQRFNATVTRVGPEVDSDRGVIAVHLKPDKLPTHVVPGLTVDVAIELKRLPKARAVPRSAVIRENGVAAVLVVNDGIARRVEVTIAAEGDDYIAVEGLDATRVVANATQVEAGEHVKEREAK